jgi:hypothetical protein
MCLVLAASLFSDVSFVNAADGNATSITLANEGGGVLKQTTLGLSWAQSDNGADIDWRAAAKFCADKGSGWRLPSVAELLSIYDKSGNVRTACGAGFTCPVAASFNLTGSWMWSNEQNNSATAWVVILTGGTPTAFNVTDNLRKRALCVLDA